MEHYKKTKTETEPVPELEGINPLVVINNGKIPNYVNVCTKILQSENEVYLYGCGFAVNKTVTVTEILKRNIEDLSVDICIFNVPEADYWESISGDLDVLKVIRNLPGIRIKLSTKE